MPCVQHDLGTNEQPEVKSDDEVEEGTKNADTTLSEDITMLQNRLADGKAHKKVKGTGHIFLGTYFNCLILLSACVS